MHTSFPSFRRTPESRKGALNDALVQIAPLWVLLFDQHKLPSATPFFERFLAPDSRLHGLVRLEPDQGVNAVFLRKAFREIVLVLPNSLNEIGGNSYVERAVPAVCTLPSPPTRRRSGVRLILNGDSKNRANTVFPIYFARSIFESAIPILKPKENHASERRKQAV
jgi:hypothetical protein